MPFRVALLGIYHESNTFVIEPTTMVDFHNGHYLKGDAIRAEYQNAHHEIGGMIEVLDRAGMELVPVFFAEATPGGTITSETYKSLRDEMMTTLEEVLPVDACLIVPHGAAVSEDFPDMDGHWMSLVRDRLGVDMPIVGTLDLHANVSVTMASSANALVAYKKNPHVDMRQRGVEAAKLLVQWLLKKVKPVQALVQLPLAISIEQQFTEHEPCKSLYAYAEMLGRETGILSLSIQHGFPYADVEEMGTSVLVVADDDPEKALAIAEKLGSYIRERRESFVGKKNDVPAVLEQLKHSPKPTLLLDMGDNVGGGAPANNCCLLEAFEASKQFRYFICIYDPQAVADSSAQGSGKPFELSFRGTVREGVKTVTLQVTLRGISDGNFTERNPRHGGQVNFRMGKTAVVSTAEGSVIMFTSLRVMPFSLEQMISQGLEPTDFDAIIAKGVNAPIAAYAPVCPAIIQVNTPGVTQADMTSFSFRHRRKPLFPFEYE